MIVETVCRPFLFKPLLNVSQNIFCNYKIKWKKKFYFKSFCLGYHLSQKGITCSKLVT